MPTRDISEETGQIVDDADLISKPVRDALNEIVSWFATTADVGISNSDVASNAGIVTTKLKHSNTDLDTFLENEHSATGVHTQVSQGITDLVIESGGTAASQVLIAATYITTENTSGGKSVAGLDADGDAETVSETILLDDDDDSMDATDGSAISETANKTYTILCLRDLTTGGVYTTKFVFYDGTSLDSAFYSTDLAGYNTRMSKAYTHAKIVGAVFNDVNEDLERPRPIGGGSTNDLWKPSPAMMATGSFTGTGSSNEITGVGFTPSHVMVKNANSLKSARFRTQDQTGAYSQYYGIDAPATETGITSIDYDGFTVLSDESVNESGDTMFWVAFKENR